MAAAVSPFLFGVFILLSSDKVQLTSNFNVTFVFTLIAMSLFYFFFRTKNYISRNQGILLLIVYIAFVVFELMS